MGNTNSEMRQRVRGLTRPIPPTQAEKARQEQSLKGVTEQELDKLSVAKTYMEVAYKTFLTDYHPYSNVRLQTPQGVAISFTQPDPFSAYPHERVP